MLVRPNMKTVTVQFGRLAQVFYAVVVKRETVHMPAHEADHVDRVVLHVVGGSVDGLARSWNTPVLGLASLRVVA